MAKRKRDGKAENKDEAVLPAPPGLRYPNEDICKILEELQYADRLQGKVFQANAYMKAINALKQLPTRLKSSKDAMKLPGIGKGIAGVIHEILTKGGAEKIDKIREEFPEIRVTQELQRIQGIGPSTAKKLYDDGIRSIEELKTKLDLIPKASQVYIHYVDELEQLIPIDEMKQIDGIVQDTVNKIDVCKSLREIEASQEEKEEENEEDDGKPQKKKRRKKKEEVSFVTAESSFKTPLKAVICSGFRRNVVSESIQIVLSHPDFHDDSLPLGKKLKNRTPLLQVFINELKKTGFVCEDVSMTETKYTGIARIGGKRPIQLSSSQQQNSEQNAPTGEIAPESEKREEPTAEPISPQLLPPARAVPSFAFALPSLDELEEEKAKESQQTVSHMKTLSHQPKEKAVIEETGLSSHELQLLEQEKAAREIKNTHQETPKEEKHIGEGPFSHLIEIHLVPWESFPTALLYFTGPLIHRMHLQAEAKKKNLALGEYSIRKVVEVNDKGKSVLGEVVLVESEKDIYKLLAINYIAPEHRG